MEIRSTLEAAGFPEETGAIRMILSDGIWLGEELVAVLEGRMSRGWGKSARWATAPYLERNGMAAWLDAAVLEEVMTREMESLGAVGQRALP